MLLLIIFYCGCLLAMRQPKFGSRKGGFPLGEKSVTWSHNVIYLQKCTPPLLPWTAAGTNYLQPSFSETSDKPLWPLSRKVTTFLSLLLFRDPQKLLLAHSNCLKTHNVAAPNHFFHLEVENLVSFTQGAIAEYLFWLISLCREALCFGTSVFSYH